MQLVSRLSRLPCRPEVQHYTTATDRHRADFERRSMLADEAVGRLQATETHISQALSLRAKFLRRETAQTVKDSASPEDKESVRNRGRCTYVVLRC